MILILVKNHFKRNRSDFKPNAKNMTAFIAIALLSLVLISLLGFILFQITATFDRLNLGDIFLTTVFFILLIVLIVYEIINIIKQLYQNDDNFIYLKLPIKKEAVFLSKIIYIYLKQIMVSILFLAVTAGVFGLVSRANGFYFMRLLIIGLILPLLPLSVASVLSIPVSFLIRFIKKKKRILTISLILILGVFFIGYIGFVQIILKFIDLTSSQTSVIIAPEIIEELKQFGENLRVSSIFYHLLINERFFINIIFLLLIIGGLTVGSYFVLKYFYFKALNNQNERIVVRTKTNIKANKPFMSIFKKEIKTLSRNPNYAFQAIVMNVLMPVFVYFTIMLTKEAGELAVGNEIVPGITILTILIFILLSNSFQGTIISREKKAYYISKIIPINPFKLIVARILFGYLLSILMLMVSIAIIVYAKFIGLTEGIFILIMSIVFLFGYTFNSVYHDYKNPQLTSHEGGFEEGMNMYKTLITGVLIAVFLGLINIGLPYILKLFPSMRKFRIMGLFIVELTATRVNLLLYLIIFITIFVYALIGYLRLRKAVMKQ